MVWAFQWFNKAVYATATLSTQPMTYPAFSSDTTAVATVASPVDFAFAEIRKAYPEAKRYATSTVQGKAAAISFSAYGHEGTYYDANTLYFDQGTGKLLGDSQFKNLNAGEKIIAMNYDIHVGAIAGLTGKDPGIFGESCLRFAAYYRVLYLVGQKKKAKEKIQQTT